MAFNKARALQEAEKLAAQGKLAPAIQQYLVIVENDPRDLGLLNTAGDLAVRDRNIPEALRLFRRLADAYAREGFTLKAIAIYRKITKLDPNTIEPLLKLAELYAAQGLGREALRLYAEALQSAERANQTDQALDIMRRIVAAATENEAHRLRLAECCEAAGRHTEAARVYLEAAEAASRRNDGDAASGLLARARELDRSAAGLGLPGTGGPGASLETQRASETLRTPEAVLSIEMLPGEMEAEPAPKSRNEVEPLSRASASSDFSCSPLISEPGATGFEEQLSPDAVANEADVSPSESAGAATVEPAASAPEFDLSTEWEALAAASATASAGLPSFHEEESRAEVEFYLGAGLAEEARRAIQALEEKFPGHPEVAKLRRQVQGPMEEPAPIKSGTAQTQPASLAGVARSPVSTGGDLLQDLARDFESHWTGLEPVAPAHPPPPPPPALPAAKPRPANAVKDFGAALSALLDDLNEE